MSTKRSHPQKSHRPSKYIPLDHMPMMSTFERRVMQYWKWSHCLRLVESQWWACCVDESQWCCKPYTTQTWVDPRRRYAWCCLKGKRLNEFVVGVPTVLMWTTITIVHITWIVRETFPCILSSLKDAFSHNCTYKTIPTSNEIPNRVVKGLTWINTSTHNCVWNE